MDGNKDEALKCVGIAKEAIVSGNKERALKFIGIAQRLNHHLCVDDLLAACENLDSANPGPSNHAATKPVNAKQQVEGMNGGEPSYTEEHVQLVRNILLELLHELILRIVSSEITKICFGVIAMLKSRGVHGAETCQLLIVTSLKA